MFAARIAKPQAKARASSASRPKQGAGVTSRGPSEAAPTPFGDLSKVPIIPPRRKDRPPSEAILEALDPPVVVQAKLAVGPVNDPHEREADRVADQVMAMPAETDVTGTSPRIQPFSSSVSEAAGTLASASVDRGLAGSGTALSPALQQDMGRRFGFDFSRVRVYADGEAGRSAEEIHALAYTAGHRVVFAPGQFVPTTADGLRLLSHELAHVVQQSGGSRGAGVRELGRHVVQRQKASDIDLARKLGEKLRKRKARAVADKDVVANQAIVDDVLADVEKAPSADLNDLELAVTETFATEKDVSDELRRIIRFVRDKVTVGKAEPFTASGGTATKKVPDKVGVGTVEAKTEVSITTSDPQVGSSGGAYTLSYNGADADKMHWMQFVWRKVTPDIKDKPGKPMEKVLQHSGRDYPLTTDEKKPGWLTDSGTSSPFYEANTPGHRTATELTMSDFPSKGETEAKALFNDPSGAPTKVVSQFHADTYLIRDMDVVYRAQTDIVWEFTRKDPSKEPSGVLTKMTVTGGKADHIEAAQRTALVSTDPGVDFLAGPTPDPLGEFTPVTNLQPSGSMDDKKWAAANGVDRVKDILNVSRSHWINETAGAASDSVHEMSDVDDVQPGLNYFARLGPAGETVYIDAKKKNRHGELPLDATGPLPSIGVILGPAALDNGKAAALETLRHEERHATHFQLSIGWLLRWRGEGAKKPFPDWLTEQHAKKKISELDFELAKTGIPTGKDRKTGNPTFDTKDTEVLAHAEGVMAGLPSLPPKPDPALLNVSKFPAPIDQLHLMRPSFDVADAEAKKLALQRVHDFCCGTLSSAQRTSFVDWIKFLLDVLKKKAPSADEAGIKTAFTGHDFFLKQMLDAVQKPCK